MYNIFNFYNLFVLSFVLLFTNIKKVFDNQASCHILIVLKRIESFLLLSSTILMIMELLKNGSNKSSKLGKTPLV